MDSEHITLSLRGVVVGPAFPFSVKFLKGQGCMNTLQAFMLYCCVHDEALPAKLAADQLVSCQLMKAFKDEMRCADKIMIDNLMSTYGEAVAQYAKAKMSEMSKVCYHTIEREPRNDGVFKLKHDFQVVMRAKDTTEQGTVTGASFASFVPLCL